MDDFTNDKGRARQDAPQENAQQDRQAEDNAADAENQQNARVEPHPLAILHPVAHWSLTAIHQDTGAVVFREFAGPTRECDMLAWALALNAERWNIYCGIAEQRPGLMRKASKNDLLRIGWLWTDLDPPHGVNDLDAWRAAKLEEARNSPNPPTLVVYSGRGLWFFWRIPTIELAGHTDTQIDAIEDRNRGLMQKYGGDKSWNVDRISRAPGFINWKTGETARVLSYRPELIYKLEDFEAIPSARGKRLDSDELRKYPELISDAKALEYGAERAKTKKWVATEGVDGHYAAVAMYNDLLDWGCGPDDALDLMWEFWNPRCYPPWTSKQELDKEVVGVENSRKESLACKRREFIRRYWADKIPDDEIDDGDENEEIHEADVEFEDDEDEDEEINEADVVFEDDETDEDDEAQFDDDEESGDAEPANEQSSADDATKGGFFDGVDDGETSAAEESAAASDGASQTAGSDASGDGGSNFFADVDDDDSGDGADGRDYADVIMAMPGLVGEIAVFVLANSRRPQPRFAVAAALTVVGLAAAQHMVTPTAQLNFYALLIAVTAAGKDGPMTAVDEILKAAGLERLRGPDGFASDIAIYKRLSTDPVTWSPVDEFADYLEASTRKNASTNEAKVNAALKKAYSSPTMKAPGAAGRDTFVAHNPCLFVTGATTPEAFASALTGKHIADGTANRLLLFRGSDKPPISRNPRRAKVPAQIVDGLRAIAFRPGSGRVQELWSGVAQSVKDAAALFEPHVVHCTPEVDDAVYEYELAQGDKIAEDKFLGNLHARCAFNAVRIATILAIGENPKTPVVEMQHWRAAQLLVDTAREDFKRLLSDNVGGNEHADVAKRMLARIEQAKNGIVPRRELYRTFQRYFTGRSRLFDDILNGLRQAGEIRLGKAPNKRGRETLVIQRVRSKNRKR